MKRKKDFQKDLYFEGWIKPMSLIIMTYAMGTLLDTMLKQTNTFAFIFAIAGGVMAIGLYYKKLFEKYLK